MVNLLSRLIAGFNALALLLPSPLYRVLVGIFFFFSARWADPMRVPTQIDTLGRLGGPKKKRMAAHTPDARLGKRYSGCLATAIVIVPGTKGCTHGVRECHGCSTNVGCHDAGWPTRRVASTMTVAPSIIPRSDASGADPVLSAHIPG